MTELSARSQSLLREKGFALDNSEGRLVLKDLEDSKRLPLAVDFLTPQIQHRLRTGLGVSQSLPKALGLRSRDQELFVFDATAGLGVDAFFIAAHGCRVRSVERSEIIYALLIDGFRRLQEVSDRPQLSSISKRISFEHGEARLILESLSEKDRPDVVYLDPMYPEETRSDSALPKKGMQVFRELLGDDLDADGVFAAAMRTARARVVVKRPLKASALGNKPTHVFAGKTARYDMYLIR